MEGNNVFACQLARNLSLPTSAAVTPMPRMNSANVLLIFQNDIRNEAEFMRELKATNFAGSSTLNSNDYSWTHRTIGTGKSTVAKMFADMGAFITDSDLIAHQVVEPGKPAWQAIKIILGQVF